jgi:hypothetical protein
MSMSVRNATKYTDVRRGPIMPTISADLATPIDRRSTSVTRFVLPDWLRATPAGSGDAVVLAGASGHQH